MRRVQGTKTRIGRDYYRLRMPMERDPETGRRREMDRRFRGTSAEADTELERMAEIARRPTPPRDVTVRFYLEKKYLPWAKGNVARSTYLGYESHVRAHIIPRHGSVMLSRVTGYDVDMLVKDMRDHGLSEQTQLNVYAVYRTALRQAVRWKRLREDPTRDSTVPRVSDRELVTLDQGQANRYLDLFAGDDLLEVPVVLAIGHGLRRCEVCGLDWTRDLKLERARLEDGRPAPASGLVIVTENRLQYGKETWTKDPKTKKSRRALILAPWEVEALLPHRAIGPVVRVNPSALMRAYRAKIAAHNAAHPDAQLPYVPFRDLRNAHGSIVLDLGGDIKAISENYGHATSQITERKYTRPHVAVQERYAATIQNLRTSPQSPAIGRDEQVSGGTK